MPHRDGSARACCSGIWRASRGSHVSRSPGWCGSTARTGTLSTRHGPPQHGFRRRFTATDVALLADMDARHRTVSGPATKKLMERAFLVFEDARFERLAGISVSHLYNLRGGTQYQRTRRHWTKTRPTGVPIGQRRAPQPNGRPGYIRIDSVHQGDQDGVNGVYHINAVDSVTQFQLVATCEKISEAYCCRSSGSCWRAFRLSSWDSMRIMAPSTSITRWPCCWRSCASSSPSPAPGIPTTTPWRNPRMARWCGNTWGMRTSRNRSPNRSTPFCAQHLNPYVNFHRPCFFPETITDAKGKERKRAHDKDMKTPYEKLKSLPDGRQYLKRGITVAQLDGIASRISDTEAALALNHARSTLFQSISAASRKQA